MDHEKIKIRTEENLEVLASAPVIISASRSSDIPAFYAKWFFHRLEKGYCSWINPFNRKELYVSFKNCKVIVFWTKNPEPIIPYLKKLDDLGIHYYFQYTLNDYQDENLEPNVPTLEKRINTFKKLSEMIGKERIIWRFDPLIMLPNVSVDDLLNRIKNIGDALKGLTSKLVFSFVDVKAYKKVQRNLINETNFFSKFSINDAEPTMQEKKLIASILAEIRDEWNKGGWNISLATCAEDIDLSAYGIEHNHCVDGDLMSKVFSKDQELLYFLRTGKLPEKNLFPGILQSYSKIKDLKDKGQRKDCGCIESKDIGMYNTCRHFCVYCYANTSRKCVDGNIPKIDYKSESLLPL